MHRVDRGPEPRGLDVLRSRYTPRWVNHYRHGSGPVPSDSRWVTFLPNLRSVFSGSCAYCEEWCRGEVEHFRPRSQFPELVYEWSNLLLACHDCNHAKGPKWPAGGYVDPCARSRSAYPEQYFDFDLFSGDLIPKSGLTAARRVKAERMILDLRLNEFQHQKSRLFRIAIISAIVRQGPSVSDLFKERLREFAARSTELSSVSRCTFNALGYAI